MGGLRQRIISTWRWWLVALLVVPVALFVTDRIADAEAERADRLLAPVQRDATQVAQALPEARMALVRWLLEGDGAQRAIALQAVQQAEGAAAEVERSAAPLGGAPAEAGMAMRRAVGQWSVQYARPLLAARPDPVSLAEVERLTASDSRLYREAWRTLYTLEGATGRWHGFMEAQENRVRAGGIIGAGITLLMALVLGSYGVRTGIAIDEARQREEREKARLAAIVASLPIGVVVIDGHSPDDAVMVGNPALEAIHGRPNPEPVPLRALHSVQMYFRPDRRTPVPAAELPGARALVTGREVHHEELHVRRPDGTWRVVLDTAAPLRDADGRIFGAVVAIQDITERKVMEDELREANAAKDRFLAILSHELRNPLAPLLASVPILRASTGDPERVRHTAEVIDRNVKLQARMVNDLLDLSRISRGKVELQRRRVDVRELVESIIDNIEPDARAAGLTIERHLAAGLCVDADPDRFQQVVMNLLSNAVKFTPAGGRVCVSTESAGGRMRLAVADTGVGIPEEMLGRVFEMFRQGEGLGERRQGLGIGLALVKMLTEMHGGTVSAASAGPGRGSRFTVELPLASVEAAAEPSAAPGPNGAGRPHLLLVEDNSDTRESLSMALELLEYDVEGVPDPESALRRLEDERPEAILCDIGLPGMDGYELMRRIRARPGMERVPAFALTGFGGAADVERARAAGFNEHITKPVDLDDLDRRLKGALAGSRNS